MAGSRYDLHQTGARGIDRLTAFSRRVPSPALARSLFWLRHPSAQAVAAVARANAGEPYSYNQIGATGGRPPEHYSEERSSIVLGHGPIVFNEAMDAVRTFGMFRLDWVELMPAESPPKAGQVLAFASRHFGVWSINACRIVYVVEPEEGSVVRYGFAYGTLRTHAISGEERFLVEWDRATDEVRFEIYKFGRPAHTFVWLFAPLARQVQRRFTREALEAVRRAVQGG